MLQTHSLGESVSGHYPRVTLGDLLIARPKGLTEPETWAMLYQAVQALQDLFLSDGATGLFSVPLITPATLVLSSRGRVKLCQNPVITPCSYPAHISGYLAPEYRPNKRYSDIESEKMWIFGLGESLKRATLTSHTATSRLSVELCQVLTDMTRPQAASRASLMYLLDVISDYCARKQQNRPFSHIVMDLHQEALAGVEMNLNTPWTLTAMPEIQGATRSRYSNVLPPPLQWWSSNGPISDRPKSTKEASTSMEDLSSSRLLNLPGTVVRPQSMCVPPTLTNHDQIFVNNDKKVNDDFETIFANDKVPVMKSGLTRASNDNGTKTFKNRCRQRRNPVQRAASRLYRAECDDKMSRTKERAEKQCVGPEFVIRANLPSKKIVVADTKGTRKTVTVVMLNGQKIEVECNPNNITAGQLFEEVIRHEHIEENFMLGLSALMAGDFVFLPSDARVCKAVNPPNNLSEITLFVRVRFFLPNLRGLRNSQARHLLYLQIRRSILEYQLPCMFSQFIELGGLALQAEFGDYVEKEHGSRDYFLLEHYVPEIVTCNREKSHQLKEEIVRCHKSKIGLDIVRAEEEFIKLSQSLPHYGGHFCMASWVQKDNTPRNVWLFISAQGINLYERLDVVNPFSLSLLEMFEWKTIQTLCYSKHYLCIIPHTNKINKLKLKKYKLKMDLKKSYFTFRLASLHHQFFLRLKTEYVSLQRLSEAFGVPLKEIKNETNSLYKLDTLTNSQHVLDLDKTSVNADTEFKIEFRFPSKKSKSNSREDLKSQRSKSVGNFSNETADNKHVFEEFQNKENEKPKMKNQETIVGNERLTLDSLSNMNIWDKRRGVKMGVRAFSNRSGHRNCRSMEAMNVDANDDLEKFSLQSVSLYYSSSSTRSPMPDKKANDVYVLDTSIHSHDVNFLPNFQESLSQSLLDKLNDLSFAEERYLCSVVIQRDQKGSFGLQITEGSDGKVYVQSVIPGGPADALKKIKKGDQIIAVNQQNLLNYKYEDALEILKKSGSTVELVLSQTKNNTRSILDRSSAKDDLENSKIKSTIDLTDLKESHLQLLKLENTVRKFKHFSYAGGSGSSFGSADTPIEKHLIESCYDITNFNKHPTSRTTDVPYHKHIRYDFESEVEPKGLHQKTVSASCSNLNYLEDRSRSKVDISKDTKRSMEDCRKISMPIALPRSLGLSRKWRGPVRYPVTPIKKERKGSEDDATCLLNISDDEQVFI